MANNEGRGNVVYGYSDLLRRPVIIDQYRRKQPIISYNPPNHNTEGYVTKKETIVEHVYTPMVMEYMYGPPSMAEDQFKDYGINNGRPQTYVLTPMTIVHTPMSMGIGQVEQYRDYGVNDDNWRRPSSPIYDRPQKVEKVSTKVQTEVIQPPRTGPISGIYWRNASNPVEPTSHGREYRNFNYDDEKADDYYRRIDQVTEPPVTSVGGFAMPIGGLLRGPTNDVGGFAMPISRPLTMPTKHVDGFGMPIGRPLMEPTNDVGKPIDFLKEAIVKSSTITTAARPPPPLTEPTITNMGGFARPIGRPLTGPTNDINKAVGFLKEAAAKSLPVTTTAPPARFTEPPVSDFPKRGSYTETIDSRDAAMWYGRPMSKTGESHTRTITSTVAKEKYGGAFVP